MGPLARTVRDAAYVLDAIYGVDSRDNYTLAQVGKTPEGGYAQFLAGREALKDAAFGLPWNSFWVHATAEMREKLLETVAMIEAAGATVVNNTEIPNYGAYISPTGWDWYMLLGSGVAKLF